MIIVSDRDLKRLIAISYAHRFEGQLDLLSQILGHTNPRTTSERYRGLNLEKIRGME